MGSTQSTDEELVRALYDEHAAALLAFVQRLSAGDRALALLRAWRKSDRLPAGRVRPWLFTTARRLVIDAYRARSARPAETSTELLTAAVTGDGIDAALNAALVIDALRSLSPEHRAVVVDYFYRGHTTTEIAAERGLPAGTVRSRVFYALRALRLALQERGVDGP